MQLHPGPLKPAPWHNGKCHRFLKPMALAATPKPNKTRVAASVKGHYGDGAQRIFLLRPIAIMNNLKTAKREEKHKCEGAPKALPQPGEIIMTKQVKTFTATIPRTAVQPQMPRMAVQKARPEEKNERVQN